jgi:soluble P-type ATPase
METIDTLTDMPYTVRLAALDRAITFLRHSNQTEADSAEVIATAARFEKYLQTP